MFVKYLVEPIHVLHYNRHCSSSLYSLRASLRDLRDVGIKGADFHGQISEFLEKSTTRGLYREKHLGTDTDPKK